MRSPDDEFLVAMGDLDDRSRRWLLAQSIPPGIIEVSPGPVTVASIETDSLGCFQFTKAGRRAFVHPVTVGGPFTDIVDLVGWFPDQPDRWWSRCYSGVPLGDEQLFAAQYWQKPVMVRRTPLSWLQAGGNGVVISDWPMSAPSLRCIPRLFCEDQKQIEEVYDRLRVPLQRVPELRVAREKLA